MTEQELYNYNHNIKPDPKADAQREMLADPKFLLLLTLTSAKDDVPPRMFNIKSRPLKNQLDKFLLTKSAHKHGNFIRGVSVAETQSRRVGMNKVMDKITGTKSHVKMHHNSLHTHSLIRSWDKNLSAKELRDAMGEALKHAVTKIKCHGSDELFFNMKGVDVRVITDTRESREYLANYLTKELSTNQSDKTRFDMFSELSKGDFNIKTKKLDEEYKLWH